MKRKLIITMFFIMFTAIHVLPQSAPVLAANPKFSLGVLTGYTDQFGVNFSAMIEEFTYDVPLAIKFSGGYNVRDAGNPWDARKVFINDNTNGDPEKSGSSLDLRLDFAIPLKLFSIKKTYLLLGPRYSMHTSTFDFIGGNEFFDITTDQFGLGAGLETYFGISPTLSFVLSGGFDYFFDSQIGGHDSFYNPDGTTISGREGYTYEDAANSINQPKYEFRFMAGLSFGL